MCTPASFIVTENKVYWSKHSDSHESIIQEYRLQVLDRCEVDWTKSPAVKGVRLVRVEITPPLVDGTCMTFNWRAPRDHWVFRVDQDCFPEWGRDLDQLEQRVREVLPDWISYHVLTEGSHSRSYGSFKVYGSTKLSCGGTAYVEAHDTSRIFLREKSEATAHDKASVFAHEEARVKSFGHSSVNCFDKSGADCHDQSTVRAHDVSYVTIRDNAQAESRGLSKILAYDNSSVRVFGGAYIELSDHSQAEICAPCQGRVVALHGDTSVKIKQPLRYVSVQCGANARISADVREIHVYRGSVVTLLESVNTEIQLHDPKTGVLDMRSQTPRFFSGGQTILSFEPCVKEPKVRSPFELEDDPIPY